MNSPEEIAKNTVVTNDIIVGPQKLGAKEIRRLGQKVRTVSRAAAGLDIIDLEAAQVSGLAVIHQPDYATLDVAAHVVAPLLAVNRRLGIADNIARNGWRPLTSMQLLDGVRVGVIGAGAIGRAVIERLRPLVSQVMVHDPIISSLPDGAEGNLWSRHS